MSMVGFPLLLIPIAIYNIIVWLMPDVSLGGTLITLTLVSGAQWPLTLSDVLLALGILMLLLEVIKGARPGAKYLTDHLLSLLVLCGAGAEFALLPQFGTSTYFLLCALALVDFLSGIALRARRGMQVTSGAAAAKREVSAAPAAARQAPQFEPASAPAVPAAASVAESVLLHHPEPTPAHPEVASHAPSPEVASPELQPGEASPPRDAPPR